MNAPLAFALVALYQCRFWAWQVISDATLWLAVRAGNRADATLAAYMHRKGYRR